MKKLIMAAALLVSMHAGAQYTVRIILTDVATRRNDDIYLTGNFNNWNPKDENYKFKPFAGGRKSLVIKDLAAGTYAFKFSRGSADKLETTSDGRDINDRVLEVNADMSQEYTVSGWKDDYPDVPRRYTASPQVRIIDTAFSIPQLGRKRRIWIYLPKGYAASAKTYPVLYMQDGQNLFNEQTAAFGEWGVDECLDTLQQRTGKECIVVGIDNGGDKRMTEYNPYDNARYGKGEGTQYTAFLVKTLKPYIDSKYRTKKNVANTFIAGSSMGALISFCAVMQYPQVFGAAGIFSPSFWISDQVFADAENFNAPGTPRFYLYAGNRETGDVDGKPTDMVRNLDRMSAILEKKPRYVIRKVTSPLGQHNEKYWRQEFPSFYLWLMQ